VTKTPRVYVIILAAWVACIAAAGVPMVREVSRALAAGPAVATLAVASTLFIAYFWLNGVKDLVYTLYFHFAVAGHQPVVPPRGDGSEPHVLLLYTTCNDFSPESLVACLKQDYRNYEVVVLDDSTDPDYRARVDEFAATHGLGVVRRDAREGFKAGNLNHYLRKSGWDFFALLDSDEIVPADYISRSLDYFAHYGNAGIVQANHVATRNRNEFMSTFSIGVDSHWLTYQSVKNSHGFMSLLGHGAMVSRVCYEAAGGFPNVVAEDLCFSIAARNAGYLTVFAPDLVCEEEYPVDFLAFKKRHSKWTQGNMEFIRRYSGAIARSRMTWFEKLDIVLFTYSLPLTALFSLYVAIHVIVLPMIGYAIVYPAWMLAPTAAFLVAPMLNDIIFHWGRMPKRKLAAYLVQSMLLYGSMFFVSLRSSVKSAFGGSTFIVTPKDTRRITLRQALRANRGEIAFGLVLGAVSIVLTRSILPVAFLVFPALLCSYLALRHNRPTDADYAGRHRGVAQPKPSHEATRIMFLDLERGREVPEPGQLRTAVPTRNGANPR
jgi:cellulose synthase/poly-beta-1,6-N-acetylglucosamine synthase-like glycosyltransferase